MKTAFKTGALALATACATLGHDAQAFPCGPEAPTTYLATSYGEAFPIHGVAGDHHVLFLVQPTAGVSSQPRVRVARRVGGAHLGELPAPPQGWAVPLSPFISELSRLALGGRQTGELWVSDVRVPPAVALVAPAGALVQRYTYGLGLISGFTATHRETWALPLNTVPPGAGLPNGFVYLGSLAALPDGQIVLTDTFTGALWVADQFGAAPRLAFIDPRFGPGPVGVINGVQRAPGGGFRPYTQVLPQLNGVSFGPGIESVTYAEVTDEVCVAPTGAGGLFCIDRDVLVDPATPPFAKTTGLREVLAPTPGLTDLTDGIVHDRFQPTSPWLYWQRAPSDTTPFIGSGYNTLRRIHLLTGAVEVVARTNTCFDWTYEITTLPPLVPGSPLTHVMSSVGQGPNNPDINLTLNGQQAYVGPSIVPVTVVGSR
jgi:hypothetical protein